jgi:exocyst complex protein 7
MGLEIFLLWVLIDCFLAPPPPHSYQDTLNKLFGEKDIGDKTSSHLASEVIRIMSILQTNLDGKSKLYKDPALTQFFLMNNIHYMVKSVRR